MEENFGMSAQEMSNMTEALKNPEFRKLLAEYCNEMADPKNQALYEQELTQYEAQRGIDLTFITPEPGFVIKTVGDGRDKVFINVSKNDKVDPPTSKYGCDANGRRGLQWSIPMTQAPPRKDVDKKKQTCTVYDVVFHPNTLHLAGRNREFRQLVVSTACDAVESAFEVRLDRINVKFPKMASKGTPKPTVIRKKQQQKPDKSHRDASEESSVTDDEFYAKVDMDNLNGDRAPRVINSQATSPSGYTEPKYKLVHRRGVDMHEVTHERDAKLNITLPHELVVTVDLPLLSSSKNVTLDVRERSLELVSDVVGAKYKLNLPLPHTVLKDQGSAKFDSSTRQLVVRMPVNRKAELKLTDLSHSLLSKQTSDSGLDSPSSHSHSSNEDISVSPEEDSIGNLEENKFLEKNIAYSLPSFSTNILDNDVVFTLNVKNVDPDSVKVLRESNSLQLKFYSIGAGFVPCHYAYFVRFLSAKIEEYSVEAWDNNVVLQVNFTTPPSGGYDYGARGDETGLTRGHLRSGKSEEKTETVVEPQSRAFEVRVREDQPKEVTIELIQSKISEEEDFESKADCDVFEEEKKEVVIPQPSVPAEQPGKSKKGQKGQKKDKKRKERSLSESHCEDLKEKVQKKEQEEQKTVRPATSATIRNLATCGVGGIRKARSISESGCDIVDPNGNLFHFKSILKRRQLNRSVSESCSSADDGTSVAVSFDMGVGSFVDIPEEEDDSDHPSISGSCKKTVTFNDVIKKQLFRADASIVGRKLKNMKKRSKKRGDNRHPSESENSECEEKNLEAETVGDEEGGHRRDSGIDFSDDGGNGASCEDDGEPEARAGGDAKAAGRSESGKSNKNQKKTKKQKQNPHKGKIAEYEFKTGLIFDLEM